MSTKSESNFKSFRREFFFPHFSRGNENGEQLTFYSIFSGGKKYADRYVTFPLLITLRCIELQCNLLISRLPRMHIMNDFIIEKDDFLQIQDIIAEYG